MRILAVVVTAVLLAGCNGGSEAQDTEPQATEVPLSSVTGLITAIEPPEGDIESFTVDSEAEGEVEVFIDRDLDYGFDLHHLHEHLETGDPVVVELETRDGVLYATSIEDA